MDTATLALALLQALGATIGAVGAVAGELFYFRAIRDGRIDEAEKAHLRGIAAALRLGMLVLLVASIGLVLVEYVSGAPAQPAFTLAYWVEMILVLLIIFFSWALSRKKVPFALGSGAAFAAWWVIALMVYGQLGFTSLGSALAVYVVSTAVIAAVLAYLRMLALPKR